MKADVSKWLNGNTEVVWDFKRLHVEQENSSTQCHFVYIHTYRF